MSIFSSIMDAIFKTASAAGSALTGGATSAKPVENVDIDAVLSGLEAKNPENLDWKKSIVDLMKLLNLDSSLNSRKQLAKELGYSGDTNDSATMNVWLHKQVIQKLVENGGKVPASLH